MTVVIPGILIVDAVVAVEGERSEGLRQQVHTVRLLTGRLGLVRHRHHGQLVYRLLCTQLFNTFEYTDK